MPPFVCSVDCPSIWENIWLPMATRTADLYLRTFRVVSSRRNVAKQKCKLKSDCRINDLQPQGVCQQGVSVPLQNINKRKMFNLWMIRWRRSGQWCCAFPKRMGLVQNTISSNSLVRLECQNNDNTMWEKKQTCYERHAKQNNTPFVLWKNSFCVFLPDATPNWTCQNADLFSPCVFRQSVSSCLQNVKKQTTKNK